MRNSRDDHRRLYRRGLLVLRHLRADRAWIWVGRSWVWSSTSSAAPSRRESRGGGRSRPPSLCFPSLPSGCWRWSRPYGSSPELRRASGWSLESRPRRCLLRLNVWGFRSRSGHRPCWLPRVGPSLLRGEAAVQDERRARAEAGVVGAQVHRGRDEFLRPPHASDGKGLHKCLDRNLLLVEVAPDHAAGNVDRGERERVHADVVLAHLDRGRLGEAVHAALRRRIESVRRSGGDAARDGGHVEDGASATLAHRANLMLQAEEETLEIRCDQLVEGALGPVRDLAQLLRAGVVDRAVESTVRLEGAGDESFDLLLTGNVGRREVDPPTGFLDLARRFRACFGIDVAGDDRRSGLGKGGGEYRAAAAGGPGDQDDLPVERRHVARLSAFARTRLSASRTAGAPGRSTRAPSRRVRLSSRARGRCRCSRL